MKRFSIILLALLLCVSMILPVNAANSLEVGGQIEADSIVVDIKMQQTLDAYFALRNDILSSGSQKNTAEYSRTLTELSDNAAIQSKEFSRMNAADNLAMYHDVYLVSSDNSATVKGITEKQDGLYDVAIYEWTWIDYSPESGSDTATDRMGYATEHVLTLQKNADNSYTIVADEYDEFEMLVVPESNLAAFINEPVDRSVAVEVTGVNSNVTLNINRLVDYADQYVVHNYPGRGQYIDYYNVFQFGYYDEDCANYVSQCLRAGGMTDDYGTGKNNGNWNGTQWWFDLYPSPQRENYNVSPPSWRFAPKFVEYWNNNGYLSVDATATSVYPGNPVYQLAYDEEDNEYKPSHVGICVGYNSDGVPIVNAHNNDKYHVPYTSYHKTIQIATTNQMLYTPAESAPITPTTTVQRVFRYISEGSSQYSVFTVTTPGTYTFESKSHTTPLDVKGYLYKDVVTSNGVQHYMYEVASNDDGGEGSNFLIEAQLSAGTYYLRVAPYDPDVDGFYYLEYSRS